MAEDRFNPMEISLLSKRLNLEWEKVDGFFRNMSQDDYEIETYTNGEMWVIKDILAHLVSADRKFLEFFIKLHTSKRFG